MVHRQGLALVGQLGQQVVQTAGQGVHNVPLEQVAVCIDRIALQCKFQIGRYVYQLQPGASLLELASQHHTVHVGHVHIQKRQLVQLQLRRFQRLPRAGADGSLYQNAAGRKVSGHIFCHAGAKGRIVITDQNVHPGKLLSSAKSPSYLWNKRSLSLTRLPSQPNSFGFASSPKAGAFGSPCKVHLSVRFSPFGRGVTEGGGEVEVIYLHIFTQKIYRRCQKQR